MNKVISRVLSEDVLDKTMELFWQKGFFNTSIDDITQASGLNRATMYKYFGGKNKLFLAMLKRFRHTINDQTTLPLQNIENGLQGIDEFFAQFLPLYDNKNLINRGCFLISTATEAHAHSKEVAQYTHLFQQHMNTLFKNILSYTRTQHKLRDEIIIPKAADYLMGNLFGLMTLCRSSVPKRIFENHVYGIRQFIKSLAPDEITLRQ